MGVVNVTPDSFSDGGVNFEPADAVGSARRMVEEGATIVDVGGESTRPGSESVSLEEELRRVVPVLEGLRGVPVSIDTAKSQVAARALELGAELVNDVTDVARFLDERLRFAVSQGIPEESICLDPGIGFGKTVEHNFELLRRLDELTALGRPILVGISRKSSLGKIMGDP